MSKRYDQEIMDGFLIYLKTGKIFPIESSFDNQRHLLRMRNDIAGSVRAPFLKRKGKNDANGTKTTNTCSELKPLPKPCQNEFTCKFCNYQLPCYLEHISNENKFHITNPNESILADLEFTKKELEYFKLWSRNLLLEQNAQRDSVPKFYENDKSGKNGKKRTEIGNLSAKCLNLENLSADELTGFYLHEFTLPSSSSKTNLDDLTSKINSHIYLSGKNNSSVRISNGFLHSIDVLNSTITLSLDRDVRKVVNHENVKPLYIDFFDSFSHSTILTDQGLGNLVNFFQPVHKELREIIIEKKKNDPTTNQTIKMSDLNTYQPTKSLNSYQKTSILKSINAEKFHLINGYPGTGKTTTIVQLINYCVKKLNLSVLISSFTNSAVDNMVQKLDEIRDQDQNNGHDKNGDNNLKILRLGRDLAMHKNIKKYSELKQLENFKSSEQLQKFYESVNIVASTVLSSDHPLFKYKKFDLAIIDEASQILEPLCLAPIFKTKKFVLVGDFLQLPPLLVSEEARSLDVNAGGGKGEISLFERLAGMYPEHLSDLRIQYRMGGRIMDLANYFCYEGKLINGKGDLELEDVSEIQTFDVREEIEICQKSITASYNITASDKEALKVVDLVKNLLQHDPQNYQNQIGIISPFNKQVLKIKNKLGQDLLNQVEVNTIDRYQGRDKKVIIISFGQQNFVANIHKKDRSILNDVRRINVAITRAKEKLILVGNFGCLREFGPCGRILEYLNK